MEGKDIRKIRKELLKWSMEKLARSIGVTLVTVYNWESGKRKPSPLAMDKIEELFYKIIQNFPEQSKMKNDFSEIESYQNRIYGEALWSLPQQLKLPLKEERLRLSKRG